MATVSVRYIVDDSMRDRILYAVAQLRASPC